jgi:hypothetical protein
MTDDEREEGAEEAIGDLERQMAAAQRGSRPLRRPVNCASADPAPRDGQAWCLPPVRPEHGDCDNSTKDIIVKLQ